jgi:MFS family permease
MTDFARIARRTTWILFTAQSLASAGFIAAATLNAILGAKLANSALWAGLPSAVYLLAGAFAALFWGRLMDIIGRRNGIAGGLLIGAFGSALVVWSVREGSLGIFLLGMALMGVASAAVQLGRFAAAEVNLPENRGRAISNVVLGGTVGAIFGPLLVGPTGIYATRLGVDELAGGYLASLVLFLIGVVVVFVGLRPDPRDVGRQVAELYAPASADGPARSISVILRQPPARLAVTAMVIGQVSMVAIMVITSLHMRGHEHALGHISAVMSAHTFGMFAFSVVSGRLADRLGRGPVILGGAAVLVLAGLTAPLSPEVLPLAISLFLLGLGWNFCFVGGSTLLADELAPAERSRTQGFNDLLVGLASALASLGSGIVYAGTSYAAIALLAGALALIPLLMSLTWMRRQPSSATAD